MHVRNYVVAGRAGEKAQPVHFGDEALVNRYGAGLHGCWLGQGRRVCGGCERYGGGREPLSRQIAG